MKKENILGIIKSVIKHNSFNELNQYANAEISAGRLAEILSERILSRLHQEGLVITPQDNEIKDHADDMDHMDIYMKQDGAIIGLHAIGYKGNYDYTIRDRNGQETAVNSNFYPIEMWGNHYDENYNMLGRGSFRIFNPSLEDAVKELEASGWVRYEKE